MTAITTGPDPVRVTVHRISEQLQSDAELMLKLKNIGIQPGLDVTLMVGSDNVRVTRAGRDGDVGVVLPPDIAGHLFVAECR